MLIRVIYTTQVKAALGFAVEEVELDTPGTLGHLIATLAERHGDTLRQVALTDAGELLPSILICVGEEQIGHDMAHPLNDGDEVTLLSAISGG
jgi:molybdopterin converting factor small subunit